VDSPAEPASGKSLADHVQIGFAYQMHLDGAWQQGALEPRQPRTQLLRLHPRRAPQANGVDDLPHARSPVRNRPLRAFENAYLIERATARARRQLAALGGNATA
jgi:hypothetical protein